MTNEIDRLKILEDKITGVIDHIQRLSAENDKLKQLVKDLKAEKRDSEDLARKVVKLDGELKKYENEREEMKGKIEAIISQIDKLGM
ncbi:MAG TPA: cell division protein ZapB [Candidatus Aminicenantes bacterium]|nr:cell division protein ZapB [Candidatus Aminicenantes bacterium]